MSVAKENAAKLSIAAISMLLILKIVTSILTGSVAIRADAVHSAVDLFGVIVGYIGIRVSGRPPDEQHAFGHGKAENIASGIIGGLIFFAAGMIAYEAIKRLITGGTVELISVGIYVTAAAIVINGVVSWYSWRVSRNTDSVALEATSRDLLADVFSSVAVLVGLVLVKLTGFVLLDSIVALLVAVLIARAAYVTVRKAFVGLMDTRLPREEEDAIVAFIEEHGSDLAGFHQVRTRKSGNLRFVDLHLVMPKSVSVEEAHKMCDHLEDDVKSRFPNSSVTIHVEPCDGDCEQCRVSSCSQRIIITTANRKAGNE